jgi:hypothetical protein
VVSGNPRAYFTPGKDPVPIVQEAGWATMPVGTVGKTRPTGFRSPDRPARSQSQYRPNFPVHIPYSAVIYNEKTPFTINQLRVFRVLHKREFIASYSL